jgi:hypothetical protein
VRAIRLGVGRARNWGGNNRKAARSHRNKRPGVSVYVGAVMAGMCVSEQAGDALVWSESLAVGHAVTHGRTPWRGFRKQSMDGPPSWRSRLLPWRLQQKQCWVQSSYPLPNEHPPSIKLWTLLQYPVVFHGIEAVGYSGEM